AEARQKALEKFKARPAADDPAVCGRGADVKAIAEAREAREKERAAIKAKEAEAREAREAIEKVEREARERREAIEKVIRDAAEAAERKAERDRRYAARKARQSKYAGYRNDDACDPDKHRRRRSGSRYRLLHVVAAAEGRPAVRRCSG